MEAKRSSDHVRAWTLAELGERFGPSRRWWIANNYLLIEAQALSKIGQRFFGSEDGIGAALMELGR